MTAIRRVRVACRKVSNRWEIIRPPTTRVAFSRGRRLRRVAFVPARQELQNEASPRNETRRFTILLIGRGAIPERLVVHDSGRQIRRRGTSRGPSDVTLLVPEHLRAWMVRCARTSFRARSGRSPSGFLFLRSHNVTTKGHAGIAPHGLCEGLSSRPSRDSISGRIVCGWRWLSGV